MRLGLVAVGTAFALIGAAVIVAVVLPSDQPTLTRSTSDAVDHLANGDWRTLNISASSSSQATMTLAWMATGDVNVSWYRTEPCSTPPHQCVLVPPLMSWSSAKAGHWSSSGTAGSTYLLYVEATPSAGVNFSAEFDEHYRTSELALTPIPFAVTLLGGSLLTGMGGVALYLGLFLPSGVYGPLGEQSPAPDDPPEGPPGQDPSGTGEPAGPGRP